MSTTNNISDQVSPMTNSHFDIIYRTDDVLKSIKINGDVGNNVQPGISKGPCRCMVYSPCGSFFASCDMEGVKVSKLTSADSNALLLKHPRVSYMTFSPFGNVIALWEQFVTTAENPTGSPNLNLYSSKTGSLLKAIVQKKSDNWKPQWSADEFLCARIVTGEVHFYAKNDFSHMHSKLVIPSLTNFALTSTIDRYFVAAHVTGKKGQPSFVRIFQFPHFQNTDVIANKSFYKAEKVDLLWNKKGSAILILTATDVSQESYYGDQGLHFVSTSGDSSIVPLQKKGPVYHIEWHPNSSEFVVTAGYMPAKTTVYNLKSEPIFDFGTGPRNITYFNPFGNIICLAGFGNLKGDVEMWDYTKKKLISKFTASDSTVFEWCPSGDYILTATTHPRLRVNNGLLVWHYSGSVVYEATFKVLLDVRFRPMSSDQLSPPELHYNESINYKSVVENSQPAKYVPPHLRNKPGSAQANRLRDDYEMPSNQRKQDNVPLSKSAIKNQKRKEAKQREMPAQGSNAHSNPHVPQSPQRSGVSAPQAGATGENEKRIRNLQKKLTQIERLKEDVAAGKKLELNQKEKLLTEDSLRTELENLLL